MSRILKPTEGLEVVRFDLAELVARSRPTDYLLAKRAGCPDGVSPAAFWYTQLEASGKSKYLANKMLNHAFRKAAYTQPTALALALCTVAPTASSTGATLVEPTYTGYAERVVEAAGLGESTEQKILNTAAVEFANCTAGSSTVLGFAWKDSSTIGSGNVLYWGTLPSTVISTSATPASFEAGHLEAVEG